MTRLVQLLFACLGCMVAIAAVAASEVGSITGAVEEGAPIAAVTAIDRAGGKRFAGTTEAATGKFRIDNLPLGQTYDVIIDFQPEAASKLSLWRLEGVNMKVPRSDYEQEQPLSDDDIATIKEKVRSMNKFEDVVEILAVEGNIQHAAMLVNKLRTKPFYGSKPGEVIWRPELWHFERPDDTWVKVQDELFVILYRERIQESAFDKKSVTFDSALGGVKLTDSVSTIDLGTVTLPDAKPGIRYRGVGAVSATSASSTQRAKGAAP